MGPFDYIQKKGSEALKPQPLLIRKETISKFSHHGKFLSSTSQHSETRQLLPISNKAAQPKIAALHPSNSTHEGPRKRSSSHFLLESDSDDNETNETSKATSKRLRFSTSVEPDHDRQIRYTKSCLEEENDMYSIIHAATIATLKQPTKYKAAFPNVSQAVNIFLQYPSEEAGER